MEDKNESDKTLAALCFLPGWLMFLSNPLITGLAGEGREENRKKEWERERYKIIGLQFYSVYFSLYPSPLAPAPGAQGVERMAGAGLTGEEESDWYPLHAHAQTAVEFHRRRVILRARN